MRSPLLQSWTRRAATALIASASCLGAGAASAEQVKLGVLRLASHAGGYVAFERGYFTAEGLDAELEFFQAAGPMAIAIASGDIDFGVTAITGALVNLAERGAVRVVGGALIEEPGVDGQKILASKAAYEAGLDSPAKLGGHSFALTQTGSSFHYMISRIAAKEGIDPATITLPALQQVGAIIAALKSGQVDSWSIQPHIAKGLDASGDAKIIGDVADYLPDYQVTTIFTSTRNATERRDVTERFLRAYARGIADYNTALVDRTAGEAEAEAVTRLIHKYVYADRPYEKAAPSIQAGAMRLQPDARLNLGSVRDQLEWLRNEGFVSGAITLEQVVDPSFVKTY
jgi:NitT/TauT family transport system substrate-binding protein